MSEAEPELIKDPAGRWLPGRSANPGGMTPDVAMVKRIARKNGPKMVETLVSIALDKKAPHASRIAAANSVLDRGYGRPEMSLSIDADVMRRKISELSVDELRQLKSKIVLGTIEATATEVAAETDVIDVEPTPGGTKAP